MFTRSIVTTFLALCAGIFAPLAGQAQQTPLTYTSGDLLIGFRASGLTGNTTGATQCYVINAGPAGVFANASGPLTLPLIGVDADLDGLNGTDWITRDDFFWGAAATTDAAAGDPSSTLYATKLQAVVGTPNAASDRWKRQSAFTQSQPSNKITALGQDFALDPSNGSTRLSTENNPKARIQNNSEPNSWTRYMPTPTEARSFDYFVSPGVEDHFTQGTAGAVLELYRMRPSGGGVPLNTPGDFLGTLSINDDATITFTPAPPSGVSTVALSSMTYSQSEADASGKVVLTLNRTGDLAGTVTVNVSTTNGTAMSGVDFTALSSFPVSFGTNETQKMVDIALANRAGFQGNRTFNVSLAAGAGATLGTPNTATVTILEGDTGVKFDSATYTVSEAGSNVAVKLVRLGGAAAFTATVNTADDDAVAGTDYTAQTNVGVDFLTTDAEKTLNIPVTNRAGIQGSRDFTATITAATNGVVFGTAETQPATTTVTITDQLVPGTLSFSAATYATAEPATGTAPVTITVNRTGGSDGAASVVVAVTGGTAQTPADFDPPVSATLTWASGESGAKTLDFTIKQDGVTEATAETILLALQSATGATLGAQTTATVTIAGEDAEKPAVTVTAPRNNARFTAGVVNFTGTATDNVGVARVEVSLAGGALLGTATNAGGTTSFNWTLDVTPEQGANVIEVRSFDTGGNASDPITINLTFTNLRPLLAGKYNGLLVNATAAELFNRNGLVQVTVTKTGSFTAKITISGTKLTVKGVFLTGGAARFGRLPGTATVALVKKARPADIPLGTLALTLDTGAGLEITGTLNDGATLLANIEADLAVYTAKRNPVAPLKNVPASLRDPAQENGKYTAVLAPDAIVVAGAPAGSGAGILTISPAGVVKFVGKLADGSPVTYSNALSNDNRWPVFMQPYAKKGFVAGEMAFDPMDADTDAEGALTWFKPAALPGQKLYPDGWPNSIVSNFMASKFLKPGPLNAGTALGAGVPGAPNTTTANIEIALADGGLTTDTSNDASIDSRSKVTVLDATAGQTAATNLKATFVTGTGLLNGSFTHPVSNKTVKFSGAVLQKTSNAFGHFLFLPTGGTGEAGAVGVVEK